MLPLPSLQGLYNMLQTDVAAAWTLAGELAGGNLALRSIVFGFGPVGMAAFAVGYTTYQGTTWMDNQLNGALHAGVLGAAEWVIEASPGQADPYFGGDGFTTDNTPMMSGICSDWEEFWGNVSQNSSANTTQLVAQIPQVIGIHIVSWSVPSRSLYTRFAVAFAREEAASLCNQPEHLVQSWLRGLQLLGQYIGCLNFRPIQLARSIQARAGTSQAHQTERATVSRSKVGSYSFPVALAKVRSATEAPIAASQRVDVQNSRTRGKECYDIGSKISATALHKYQDYERGSGMAYTFLLQKS